MRTLVVVCLLPLAFAVPPKWYPEGKCGLSKFKDAGEMVLPSPSIVGGIEARPHEFPWQVSLKSRSMNKQFCGGSIINDRWILTAAHCISSKTPKSLYVTVGEHSLEMVTDQENNFDVEALFPHEKFPSPNIAFDIGLIKLTNKISFDENVSVICAPESKDLYVHKKVSTSGWGLVSPGSAQPDLLRYVTLNTTSNEECLAKYPDLISDDMICASDNRNSSERDSCQRDSGGPLVYKVNGVFSLVGVVSWGKGCASGYPGVYARVGYFEEWILKKLKEN